MVAWTAFATWAYADPGRRGVLLLVADLAVTLALLGLTPVVKGPWFNATVPGFWVMAALLAWAVRFRAPGGLVAGVLIGGADLLLRDELNQTNYGNFFLLMIGGPIVGFMCGSLQQMAAERDEAQRFAAAAAERARLARVVHDGVLQVLALVQRKGAEIGGEGAELGRLAGEQESALRTLIRSQDAVTSGVSDGVLDLASQLGRLSLRPGVDVVVPGGPVCCRPTWRPSWSPWSPPASTTWRCTSVRGRRRGCCSSRSATGSRCRCATTAPASPRVGSRRPRRRVGSA